MIANRGKSAGLDIPLDAGLTAGDVAGNLVILQDNTEYVASAMDRALAEALDEIGEMVVQRARELCPVDTGRLRNSITHRMGGGGFSFPGMGAAVGKEVTVGSNVEYAAYVELGTSRTDAQPFLWPAAEDYAGEYRRVVEEHMRDGS